MTPRDLEAVYDALAAALDRAGPLHSADLLARLVLLLAAEAVERGFDRHSPRPWPHCPRTMRRRPEAGSEVLGWVLCALLLLGQAIERAGTLELAVDVGQPLPRGLRTAAVAGSLGEGLARGFELALVEQSHAEHQLGGVDAADTAAGEALLTASAASAQRSRLM